MRTTCCTLICLTALGLASTLGQQPVPPAPAAPPRPAAPTPAPPPGEFSQRLQNIIQRTGTPPPAEPSLTKFNLDFPGGTPKELVAAIEKATGRPLNAIVNDEFCNTKLPALKMTSVTVPELFQALGQAGGGFAVGNSIYSNYSFMTQGRPSDDSIWYFHAGKAPLPEKVCRFYSLAPYVDHGVSVDDITTAIETGWKMLGETNHPKISFHKDTKLLIAVGEPSKLQIIDAVLRALELPKPGPQIDPVTGLPQPATRPDKAR